MTTYTVLRKVDAFVYYTAEVEAVSAIEAAEQARRSEEKYNWTESGSSEYDARNFVTLDETGNELPETETGDL